MESSTRKIKIGFTISISTLILLTALLFYNYNLLLKRADWVDHTNKVLLHLENILSVLKDAETGQRGYLITHDPDYLEPYIGSYHKVFETYNEVRSLTIDNPKQQSRMDTLRVLINERFKIINTIIDLEQKGNSDSAKSVVIQGSGKRVMDSIRKLIKVMENEEVNLRKIRYEAVKSSSFITPVLTLIASGFSLLIAIVFYGILNRDNKKRIESELNLELANSKLELSLEELAVREDQLRELNLDLEDRVQQRTDEVLQKSIQLNESEKRYRYLIEGVMDYAIFMLDKAGNITSWNYGAERLMGYKAEEVMEKHFTYFYTKEALEDGLIEQELEAAKKEGRYEQEGWSLRKDGSMIWASVVLTVIYDDEHNMVGFSKIIRDLTDRKHAEDNLKKINNDLDTFVYTASHDLKAPITNLEGLLLTIRDEVKEQCTQEFIDLLGMMDTSINKLKIIIDELSNVSRIQKDLGDDIQQINVEGLLEEFKINHSEMISISSAKIYTNFQVHDISFSKRSFISILDNLLTNAIKYRSPKRSPEILVSTWKEDQWIILSVKDNGLGIDMNRQEKLFGMFQRLHDHVEGTGVGLYIVKRIIENAEGKIKVVSKLGEGSLFKVYFKSSDNL
jgi:PAS domain S-box-containing protein